MRLARKNDPLCPVVRRPGRPAGKEHFLMIPGRQVYRFFSTLFFFLFFNRTHQFCIRQTGIRDGEKACPRRWCDGVSFCTNTALRIAGYAKRKKEIFVPKNFTGAVVCEAFQPSIRGGDWQHYRLFFFLSPDCLQPSFALDKAGQDGLSYYTGQKQEGAPSAGLRDAGGWTRDTNVPSL